MIDDTLKHRGLFAHWTSENVRFGDTDMIGHVNHATMVTLFEVGRAHLGFSGLRRHLVPSGAALPVVHIEVGYHRELTYPNRVDIGFTISKIGRSSFTVGEAIFNGEACIATALVTHVLLDRGSGKSAPLPQPLRNFLESFRAGGEE